VYDQVVESCVTALTKRVTL